MSGQNFRAVVGGSVQGNGTWQFFMAMVQGSVPGHCLRAISQSSGSAQQFRLVFASINKFYSSTSGHMRSWSMDVSPIMTVQGDCGLLCYLVGLVYHVWFAH